MVDIAKQEYISEEIQSGFQQKNKEKSGNIIKAKDEVKQNTSKILDLTHLLGDNHISQLGVDIYNDPGFEDYVLNIIKTTPCLTRGQEGEIYKIEYGHQNFIVAKKRFDPEAKREYLLQEKAYDISLKSKSGVKVPEPLKEFGDGEKGNGKNSYLIMEFIEGKTLYTMIWQEIVNSHLIGLAKKHIVGKYGNNNEYLYKKFNDELNKFISDYSDTSNGQIEFKNDYESIEGMRIIGELLFELGVLDGCFNTSEFNPEKPTEKNYIIETGLLEKYMPEISLFDTEDYKNNIKNLRTFLNELHESGFYHNDIGKNFRNIMFGPKGIYVIDFGRSVSDEKNYNYEDGYYANDLDVVWQIQKTKIKDGKNEVQHNTNTSTLTNEKIIEKGKILGLNIGEGIILQNKLTAKNIKFSKVLNDFISPEISKHNLYNWFINNPLPNDNWKLKTIESKVEDNNKGLVKLFVLLSLQSTEKLKIIEEETLQILSESTRTGSRKFKYATLFNTYIQTIKN